MSGRNAIKEHIAKENRVEVQADLDKFYHIRQQLTFSATLYKLMRFRNITSDLCDKGLSEATCRKTSLEDLAEFLEAIIDYEHSDWPELLFNPEFTFKMLEEEEILHGEINPSSYGYYRDTLKKKTEKLKEFKKMIQE